MTSSLATQLAQGASLNSVQLLERARKKPAESYLFTGRDANKHDLESLYALASNAFIQLRQLTPTLSQFEHDFFSDASKNVDRTLLPGDEGRQLNVKIGAFLPMLGRNLMDIPTGRVLEWMVRRFRVHEFNVEDLLALFLPYHESPHFAKMVTILHISPNSTWSFLNAHKSAAQSLQRSALEAEMFRNVDVTRFVASLLPSATKGGYAHRTLVAFHTGIFLDFIAQNKTMDTNISAVLLPSIIESAKSVSGMSENAPLSKDIVLSGYLLLSAFSQKCHLTSQAVSAILVSMASGASRVAPQQFVTATLSVLSPQDLQLSLPPTVVKRIVTFENLPSLLEQTFEWSNSEKLLLPLASSFMTSTHEQATKALKSLILSPKTPSSISHRLIEHLVLNALKSDAPSSHTRDLLLVAHQRRQEILDAVTQQLIADDEGRKDALEQLLFSLTLIQPSGEAKDLDTVVASMDTTAAVRAGAIAALYKRLEKSSLLDPAEVDSVRAALLARVKDPQQIVVEALYEKSDALVPVVIGDLQSFTSALADTLSKSDTSMFRLHLTFVIRHVGIQASPEVAQVLFEIVLFPYLLHSKDRRHGTVAWELLAEASKNSKASQQYELLNGCNEVLASVKEAPSESSQGQMNVAIASRIATNVLSSNDRERQLEFLLKSASSSDPHARAFAQLIVRAILGQVSGAEQVALGERVFNITSVKLLQSLQDFDGDINASLSDEELGQVSASKPKNPMTTAWLQMSLLACLASIVRPPGVLALTEQGDDKANGTRYIQLMRRIYAAMNTADIPSAMTAYILRSIFFGFGNDTLAFLAGTWLLHDQADPAHTRLRHTSLAHAYAFLTAHEHADQTVDFQTIVPAFLVALQDDDALVRQAAAHCIAALDKICQPAQAHAVYAFDTIYGPASKDLQYLDWEDMRRYVSWLSSERTHFVRDALETRIYHRDFVSQSDGKKVKKKLAYQQKVLCFILSHALVCNIPSVKIALLRLVQGVPSPYKARTLLPLLSDMGKENPVEALRTTLGARLDELTALVIEVIDHSTVPDLEDGSRQTWEVYLSLLRVYCRENAPQLPRSKILRNLRSEVVDKLSLDRRFELARVVMDLASKEADMTLLRPVLEQITEDVQIVIRLLTALQPALVDTAHRAPKRARVDMSEGQDIASKLFTELSTLAEVLGNAPLLGSLQLVSSILDTLSRVVHAEAMSRSETLYIQQRLMAAVERSASRLTAGVPGALRLDILVDIIRMSDSPQTSNQALLLLSTLARLAPDSVLHNIMPVFTFMGSNVLHRDDSYSFRVIQKTVDSIVPVMVTSLTGKHEDRLDLLIGARNFIRVFTDAANHIPRHRRTQFFIHFVDVLGPNDFLSLVCMLFISKTTNRIVRQQGEDLRSTLALMLALMQHCPASIQLRVLQDLFDEAARLLAQAADPEGGHRAVLDVAHDDERNAQIIVLLRRRAQAILIFSGHVVEQTPTIFTSLDIPKNAVERTLVALLEFVQSSEQQQEIKEIRAAGRATIGHCLRAMPAIQFLSSVVTILTVPKPFLQLEAVKLLAERIILIADHARKSASASVIQVIHRLKEMLASSDKDLVSPILVTIREIASSTLEGEESALSEIMPLVIAKMKNRQSTDEAVAALVPLSEKLGPRVIPFFRDVITETVTLLDESLHRTRDVTHSICENALGVLHALFASIPSFWGDIELKLVFGLFLGSRSSAILSDPLQSLVRSIAKKAPSQVLFPALFGVQPASDHGNKSQYADQIEAYFELFRRVLRAAARPAALENVRPAFKLILDGFDARQRLADDDIPRVEKVVISAFTELVTKMNETAFRPLFRRFFDWSFGDVAVIERRTTFLNAYAALLDYFKSLMTPYLSIVLSPLLDLLRQYARDEEEVDEELWTAALDTLAKSFTVDEGVFWREDKLSQIMPALILQAPLSASLSPEPFLRVLDALTAVLIDDAQLKTLNLTLLMHTRNEEASIRLCTLKVATSLWDSHGDKLMGFAGETATFIAECAEDENDEVVRAARLLKEAVERASGERLDAL